MKLHKLTIKNLNSLRGEHLINFDAQPLCDAQLFLVSGPTGAGKSTIFDAICLALFGKTPRLSEDHGRDEHATKHIMSWGTAEAEACLIFSKFNRSGEQEFWQARWSLQRAHKRVDKDYQKPIHEFMPLDLCGYNSKNEPLWKECPDKLPAIDFKRKKELRGLIDIILEGLSLEDFKRSVLLAQGEFDAFLSADEKAKASLLERLTNTEHYRQVGERAERRYNEAREAHKLLDEQLKIQGGLSDEEHEALKSQQLELEQEHETLILKHRELEAARSWLNISLERKAALTNAQHGYESCVEHAQALVGDREALALHVSSLDARPSWLTADRCRDALTQAQRAQRAHDESRARYAQDIELATQELTAASAAHNAACADHASQRDILALARQLERDLKEHTQEILKLRAEAQTLNERRLQAKLILNNYHEQEQAKAASHKEYANELALLVDAARLVDERDQLLELSATMRLEQDEAARRRQQLARSTEKLSEAQAHHEEARAERARAQEALDAQQAALRGAQERAGSELRSAAQLEQRQNELAQAEAMLERLAQTLETLASLEQTITAQETTYLTSLQTQQEARAQLKRSQEQLLQAQLAAKLAENRHTLTSGEPCMLCGGLEHPRAGQDDAREREALEHVTSNHRQSEAALDTATSDALRAKEQLAQLQADTQRHEAARGELEAALRISLDAPSAEEHSALYARREALTSAVSGALELVREVERAQEELGRCSDACVIPQQALTHASLQLEGALSSQREAQLHLEESLARLERCAAATRTLLGLPTSHPLEQLAQALRDAKERADRASELAQQLTLNEQQSLNLKELSAQQQALLSGIVERERELGQRHDDAVGHAEQLREQLAQRWSDERTATEVELEQLELITRCEEKLDAAKLRHAQLSGALLQIEQELADDDAMIATRQADSDAAELALSSLLRALGFDDEASARAAQMDERAAQQRTAALANADSELANAQRHLDEALAQLAQHEAAPPLHAEHTAEEIEALLQASTTRQEAALSELGAVKERLRTQRELIDAQAQAKAQLKEAETALRLWETMHKLIGQNHGRNFMEEAQRLNLERLLVFANQHMEILAPRYRLKQELGEVKKSEGLLWPTLKFKVSDLEQTGSYRHVTTLSGGESFKVSLALALALADMRQGTMRQETLLLDEGFGTLDPLSLREVIETLRQLPANTGRRVGLISHVESLKEQIAHQIIVEPNSLGHSTLRIEPSTL